MIKNVMKVDVLQSWEKPTSDHYKEILFRKHCEVCNKNRTCTITFNNQHYILSLQGIVVSNLEIYWSQIWHTSMKINNCGNR